MLSTVVWSCAQAFVLSVHSKIQAKAHLRWSLPTLHFYLSTHSLFRRKSQTGGAKARVTFTLRRGKPEAEGILFPGEIFAPRAQIARCGFWALPRSRGPQWARAWGRRMGGSRGWDPQGGAQREHPRAAMHPRAASSEEPRLGAPREPCLRRVGPAGHRHSPSRGISPATPACPGC